MFLSAIDQHLSRYSDLGKLFARLTVAAFMLPHGVTKLPFYGDWPNQRQL